MGISGRRLRQSIRALVAPAGRGRTRGPLRPRLAPTPRSARATPLGSRLTAPLLGPLYRRVVRESVAALSVRELVEAPVVLDAACGDGVLAAQIAARLPAARVIGLDESAGLIARAKARPAGAGAGLRYVTGEAAVLPFDSGSIDLVVATLAIERWANPSGALAEIHRVLRPGGLALVYELRLMSGSRRLVSLAKAAGLPAVDIRSEVSGRGFGRLFVRLRIETPVPVDPADLVAAPV